MIFLVGLKSGTRRLGSLTAMCTSCAMATEHHLYRKVPRLSVFFVPTIPVGYQHFTVCLRCSLTLKVTAAEVDRLRPYLS